MGSLSIMHWLVVVIVVVLLFGRNGRIARTMGDVGQGIREFKAGLTGDKREEDADKTAKLPSTDDTKKDS